MEAIVKYFHSIIALVFGIMPSAIGLGLFDHSKLAKMDLHADLGGVIFWSLVCVFYSAMFFLLYKISVILVPKKIWATYKIVPDYDDWIAIIVQMTQWSTVAILVTFLRHGNFYHFIGNSFIVALSVNIFLLILKILEWFSERKNEVVENI